LTRPRIVSVRMPVLRDELPTVGQFHCWDVRTSMGTRCDPVGCGVSFPGRGPVPLRNDSATDDACSSQRAVSEMPSTIRRSYTHELARRTGFIDNPKAERTRRQLRVCTQVRRATSQDPPHRAHTWWNELLKYSFRFHVGN
jgi:hypothetical protein